MRRTMRALFVLSFLVFCVACGGGGGAAPTPASASPPEPPPPPPTPLTVTVNAEIKSLNFSWTELPGSTHYRLLENPDGHSGFTQVGADIPAGTLSASLTISVHMFDFAGALYIVEGCDAAGCTSSIEVNVMNEMISAIGYFKASNTDMDDFFGDAIALSEDGRTMAVAAHFEESNASGINGDQSDNSAFASGAVYVFRHDGTDWFQQAYVKASNTEEGDAFGDSLTLSADGNTLAIGATGESSNASGINGDEGDNSVESAGAVYVFRFDGSDWFQQAYVKASNTDRRDRFGSAVALSRDGATLSVGATGEDSLATGIGGDQTDNSAADAGAVYVYRYDGTGWAQQAYIKASNTDAGDRFGDSVAVSDDGNTLSVAAGDEDSLATGIGGDQADNSAADAGAVYVYRYDGTDWSQQAYIKASNTDAGDRFGRRVALSGDGATLAVSSRNEDSNASGINGNQDNNSVESAGAVYVYRFDNMVWAQQAYIKASNTRRGDEFGGSLAMNAAGTMLAIGARNEASCAAGVGGDQNGNGCDLAGAAYVFALGSTDWAQTAYVKASNPDGQDQFGRAVALSGDGATLAVGAAIEHSLATGIGGNQSDNSASASPGPGAAGAVYVY